MDTKLWEFPRFTLGVDPVLGGNFGIGPYARLGLANDEPFVFGLRLAVAYP